MDFPLVDLMDEAACYAFVVNLLHPNGLACPRCAATDGLRVHRRHRAPVLDYRCLGCRRVFNAWTQTVLDHTHRRPSQIVLILRGIAQGTSTARLARELFCDRGVLLQLRHRLQQNAVLACPQTPLVDEVAEADEMYQNAGEKRHSASQSRRPAAPARQQAARPRHLRQRPPARRGGRRP